MSLIVYGSDLPKEPEQQKPVERLDIDALPYVDEYDTAMQQTVAKLIEQEMKTFRPPNYLQDLPPVEVNFKVCGFITILPSLSVCAMLFLYNCVILTFDG